MLGGRGHCRQGAAFSVVLPWHSISSVSASESTSVSPQAGVAVRLELGSSWAAVVPGLVWTRRKVSRYANLELEESLTAFQPSASPWTCPCIPGS